MARWVAGRWRIVKMERWDREAMDLIGPAFIELKSNGHGSFRFIVVEGFIDARPVEREGRPTVEFAWDGTDEGDQVSGRGWAVVEPDGSLIGHLFIHLGDDSGFRAVKAQVSE